MRAGESARRNTDAQVTLVEQAAQDWRTLARQAGEAYLDSDARLERFFDVHLGSPDGETLAREYLAELVDARGRMRSQAAEGNR
jgi:hypothetical protein